jgi:hypothetical protein
VNRNVQKGKKSVNDAEHTGCSTSTGNEELEEAAAKFLNDRTVPITKIAQNEG